MNKNVTVVLADEFEIIREGISSRLAMSADVEVVGEASTGFDALKLCRNLNPDIVLLDLDITRPSGSETLSKMRKSCPDTKIIILATDPSPANAFFVLGQGAVGFIPKQANGSAFVNAIDATMNGFTYLPVGLLDDFVQSRKNISKTGNPFGLSPREIEIMSACVSGQNTKEVAREFDISVRTVETHRSSIYRKTLCNCVADLERVASAMM